MGFPKRFLKARKMIWPFQKLSNQLVLVWQDLWLGGPQNDSRPEKIMRCVSGNILGLGPGGLRHDFCKASKIVRSLSGSRVGRFPTLFSQAWNPIWPWSGNICGLGLGFPHGFPSPGKVMWSSPGNICG